MTSTHQSGLSQQQPQPKQNKKHQPGGVNKRRKVAKACLFCKRSHMTCDDSRPCQRCIKREIGHLCCDEPPSAEQRNSLLLTQPTQPQPQPQPPAQHYHHQHHQPVGPAQQSLAFDPSSAQQSTSQFEGDYRGEESLIDLSEFLNNYPGLFNDNQPTNHQQQQQTTINYDQILSSSSASSESNNDPSLAFLNRLETTTTHQQQQQSTNNTLDLHLDFNPQQQHHHHHQNQTQDRLAQIIRASDLHPFDYSKSERDMNSWIDNKISEPNKTKIQTLWNDSKNLFISTTNQQNQEDQIESEYEFQRNLLTCIPILETLPIPGCIWRRSGEIYKTNSQFNSLIGIHSFPSFDLFSTTTTTQSNSNNNPHNHSFVNVHRLWDIDSSLNFLEKFNRIALDDGQKAVLTSCVLYKFHEKEVKQEEEGEEGEGEPVTSSQVMKRKANEEVDDSSTPSSPQPGPTNPSNYTPKAHHQETESALSIDETSLYKNYTFVDPIHKAKVWEPIHSVNCTFSFTVRRDSFGLPCLIIGNFL
ncbi:hypothetical protein PSTT_06394 [Puccinia striiformis]|nr:hypothetical protein PSTT_06394 [Puccinia striiformis]